MTAAELKEAIKALELTQMGLARKLGIANGTMSNYSSGRHKVPALISDMVTRLLAGEDVPPIKKRGPGGCDPANVRRRKSFPVKSEDAPVVEEGRRAMEVRVINEIELGPLSRGLLRAVIDAIHALPVPAGTIRIKPEIAEAARGGDRYRQQATERAGGMEI